MRYSSIIDVKKCVSVNLQHVVCKQTFCCRPSLCKGTATECLALIPEIVTVYTVVKIILPILKKLITQCAADLLTPTS